MEDFNFWATMISAVIGILATVILALLAYYKKSNALTICGVIILVLLFSLVAIVSIYKINQNQEISRIKKNIIEHFQEEEEVTGPTKYLSEPELIEHIEFLRYDEQMYRKTIINMCRDNELKYEPEKIDFDKYNTSFNLRFFYLSRELTDKLQNATQ